MDRELQHFCVRVGVPGEAGVADRVLVGGNLVRERDDGMLRLDSLTPLAVRQHMHVDERIVAVGYLYAPGMDGFICPLASQAKLSPGSDGILDASVVRCRVDGIQLREGDLFQRIVLVHDEDDAVRESLDRQTAARDGDRERLVAKLVDEWSLLAPH